MLKYEGIDWTRRNLPENYEVVSDLFEMVCGKFVGEGTTRIVFDYLLMSGYVIKIEKEARTFNNIMEYELWNSLSHAPEFNKWLAPCIEISPNGRWLIQKKIVPINDKNKKDVPAKIPYWLSDMKFANYGFIGKQFVSCDYPSSISIIVENTTNRMKSFKSHLGEK